MALLLTSFFGAPAEWRKLFAAQMPDLDVRIWPEVGNEADIEVAAVTTLPRGKLKSFPNLKMIVSLLAGADVLLSDPELPDVPIVRAGNPDGDEMMSEAALLHVLRHHRHLPAYWAAQQRCEWISLPRLRARERKVGVMGLGVIGLAGRQGVGRTRLCGRGLGALAARPRWNRDVRRARAVAGLPGAQRDRGEPVAAHARDARHSQRRRRSRRCRRAGRS